MRRFPEPVDPITFANLERCPLRDRLRRLHNALGSVMDQHFEGRRADEVVVKVLDFDAENFDQIIAARTDPFDGCNQVATDSDEFTLQQFTCSHPTATAGGPNEVSWR